MNFSRKYNIAPFCFLVLFLSGMSLFSQNSDKIELQKKVVANGQLFKKNIDEAFQQMDELLEESLRLKDSASELKILDRKCRYYYAKRDAEKLMVFSEQLKKKSEDYHNIQMQGMSHIYLAETYSINQFYDKAIKELESSLNILKDGDTTDVRIFFTRVNTLNSFANIYNDKGEPQKAVEKLLEVVKSYDKLPDPEDVKRYQYINYSNLANTYVKFDLKNAKDYALKSIRLKPASSDDNIMVANYFVLGMVCKEEKKYKESLDYFMKSYDLTKKSGELLNSEDLYQNLVEINRILGDSAQVVFFEEKLKEIRLSTLESKYNSLQKIMDKDATTVKEKKEKKIPIWIFYVIGASILIVIGGWIYVFRKKQETKEIFITDYDELIEMIRKDDPAFMFAFEKLYPDFSDKLLHIDPTLNKSEIEFCALLKLNLSTKKIAELKFIEIRTVQNKKYRIRKKLNIPPAVDIYNWFASV